MPSRAISPDGEKGLRSTDSHQEHSSPDVNLPSIASGHLTSHSTQHSKSDIFMTRSPPTIGIYNPAAAAIYLPTGVTQDSSAIGF